MAHFYAEARGRSRTTAHRLGTRTSGVETIAASWQGCVRVELRHDEATGLDVATVTLSRWRGAGVEQVLYAGPVGGLELATERHSDTCNSVNVSPTERSVCAA